MHGPVHGAANTEEETESIRDHDESNGLDFGVGVVGELSDDPPVALLDERDENSEEEKADYKDAGAVVAAALSNGVHVCCLMDLGFD